MRTRAQRTSRNTMQFWLVMYMAVVTAIMGLHWWQMSQREDSAWLWSCHTMGSHRCGPDEPLIEIHPERLFW